MQREVISVRDLAGRGNCKACTIVGGGHSNDLLEAADITHNFVISCNLHAIDYCDMVIFHDADVADRINSYGVLPDFVLSHKALLDRCKHITHVYSAGDPEADKSRYDIIFGDTGFHAMQIADRIMGFDEILLFGFDYAVQGQSYHAGEEVSDQVKMGKFLKHSVGRVAPMINAYQPLGRVYTACGNGVLKWPLLPRLTTRFENK